MVPLARMGVMESQFSSSTGGTSTRSGVSLVTRTGIPTPLFRGMTDYQWNDYAISRVHVAGVSNPDDKERGRQYGIQHQ